jgi:hypothetical protein
MTSPCTFQGTRQHDRKSARTTVFLLLLLFIFVCIYKLWFIITRYTFKLLWYAIYIYIQWYTLYTVYLPWYTVYIHITYIVFTCTESVLDTMYTYMCVCIYICIQTHYTQRCIYRCTIKIRINRLTYLYIRISRVN